jgi:DNA repair exonuclease SbcCD ATPase subunit
VLERENLKISRCDPDSASYLTSCSSNNSHGLKRSASTSTLRSTRHDLSLIEERYQALEDDYHQLLQETQRKQQLFQKQSEELQKYKSRHAKDRKEIERLQSLIAFAKKTGTLQKKCMPDSSAVNSQLRKQKHLPSPAVEKSIMLQRVATQTSDFLSPKGINCGTAKMGRKEAY